MRKRIYFVILMLCLLASVGAISYLIDGIAERGFGKVNYGALIPACIAGWSYAKWRREK